jgi:beta-lactamase superfamily II metal-dependent hydrolase
VCNEIQASVEESEIAVHEPVEGLSVDLGGPVLRVLGADEEASALRLEYGETCVLLAAGLGPDGLQSLVAHGADLRCDVLQVDARALAARDSAAFLQAVWPGLVVLTGDPDRAIAVGDLGAPVVRVSDRGRLTVYSDGTRCAVR